MAGDWHEGWKKKRESQVLNPGTWGGRLRAPESQVQTGERAQERSGELGDSGSGGAARRRVVQVAERPHQS